MHEENEQNVLGLLKEQYISFVCRAITFHVHIRSMCFEFHVFFMIDTLIVIVLVFLRPN